MSLRARVSLAAGRDAWESFGDDGARERRGGAAPVYSPARVRPWGVRACPPAASLTVRDVLQDGGLNGIYRPRVGFPRQCSASTLLSSAGW